MCGRFVQYSDPDLYASRFALDALCHTKPRYNLASTQPVLAIRETDAGERELVALRWGLVPAWSKGPDNRYSMINARAETVKSKPVYRNAFQHRRCLTPAEGFHEWKTEPGRKTRFLIHPQDRAPFAMAGLWERWHGEDGARIASCTILVTDANALVRTIHDRMPVILARKDYGAWLDPGNQDADGLLEILKPAPLEHWALHPVSRRLNSPRNDGPELLDAVESE